MRDSLFMRTALWYSLGWISIGLEGVRRPSLFTVPDKSCREEGLNLDWFPLRVLRAVSAEGAPSLALLKVRDGRFIETSVCYRWDARTNPELHQKAAWCSQAAAQGCTTGCSRLLFLFVGRLVHSTASGPTANTKNSSEFQKKQV